MSELPKKDDAEPAAPHKNGTDTNRSNIEAIADGVIAAFVKINRANRKAENAEYERNHRREKRRFIVELIEVGLILVYATVTIFEWRTFDMERQTMEQEFKSAQARDLIQKTNADRQLVALQGQLNEMKKAREQDQRAWVFVTIPNDALGAFGTNDITVNLTEKNIGKTPALVTHIYGAPALDPKNIPPHDPFGTKSSLMLIPNQEGNVVITLPNIIGVGIFQNIKIYIFGTVFYRDITGVEHWSQFCFQFDRNGALMVPQNFHNSCDDLEGNQTN